MSSALGPSVADAAVIAAVQPEPDLVQLLTPEGQRVEHPDYPLTISDDEIGSLYRDLVLVRRIDSEAIALQRQGELGLWASLLGQEGAQIGAGRALRPQDMAFPTYREHGVAWCKDVDPLTLARPLPRHQPRRLGPLATNNFNLYTIVIGAQTLHATGYAMGVTRDGAMGTGDPDRDTAVIAFFGDGASSQGDVNEAFVWAGAGNLPVVFFCQNNQWAISEPVATQSAGAALPPGQPASASRASGSTATTCWPAWPSPARPSTTPATAQGPTLIEAYTYRMNPHTTNDDPRRYRPRQRVRDVEAQGPASSGSAPTSPARPVSRPDFFAGIEDGGEDALAEHIRSGCRDAAGPDAGIVAFDRCATSRFATDDLREQRDRFRRLRLGRQRQRGAPESEHSGPPR